MTRAATLRNPIGQFLRNSAVSLLAHLPAFRANFVTYLSELTIHYPHSPLSGETHGNGWPRSGIEPGERVPDARLKNAQTGEDRRLHELLRGTPHDLLLLPNGAGVNTLVAIGRQAEAAFPGLVRAHLIVPATVRPAGAEALASVYLDPDATVRGLLGARDEALALVRPDGYLGYRGQPASWDALRAHLDRYLVAPQ